MRPFFPNDPNHSTKIKNRTSKCKIIVINLILSGKIFAIIVKGVFIRFKSGYKERNTLNQSTNQLGKKAKMI